MNFVPAKPLLLAAGILCIGCAWTPAPAAEKILFDFGPGFDPAKVVTLDAQISPSETATGPAVRVMTGHEEKRPGFSLSAPEGVWDLSPYFYVAVDVKNLGLDPITIGCRIDNAGADGVQDCVTETVFLRPGEKGPLYIYLRRKKPEWIKVELAGMRGNPWTIPLSPTNPRKKTIDPALVTQLVFFVQDPTKNSVFEIQNIRTGGDALPVTEKAADPGLFFPFIDEFGQYAHRDWPGKIHSPEELALQLKAEERDLAAHPAPAGWNNYGGWADGPKLNATGFFYPAKHEGKWWLVDPEGRLFFSQGIDCVLWTSLTPVDERTDWFQSLPSPDSEFKTCFVRAKTVLHGEYQGRQPLCFDFGQANLRRKYGPEWQPRFIDTVHRQLRSWGINTIGNWSAPEIYSKKRTPYVVPLHPQSPPLQGSSGYWSKFPDVFDPQFKAGLQQAMSLHIGKSAGDPWCIGYFVDNELGWGDAMTLAEASLASPPDQAAKKVFLEDLETKYRQIEKLNEAWKTNHPSWSALAGETKPPAREHAQADLIAFNRKFAEAYFRTCRDVIKAAAPHNLYLGCRFAEVNDTAVEAAAKYCDVVSYNLYQRSVARFALPAGVDAPVLIGEFHFGSLDRGLFHPGVVLVGNQAERAAAYKNYVQGALRNPAIVGCHWFQYADQSTTGRPLDGENFQIGFVDICNTPYPETRAAARELGSILYHLRAEP